MDRLNVVLRLLMIGSTPFLMAMRTSGKGGSAGCEAHVVSVETYTAEERAAAAEFVAWISYTHPLIHRVISAARDVDMRRDFTQIPTAYMLVPRADSAPETLRRVGEVCKFNTPWLTRPRDFNDYRRISLNLSPEGSADRVTTVEREDFIRHLVKMSRYILETISDPNLRSTAYRSGLYNFLGQRQSPLLNDSPASVTMRWYWVDAFNEAEFKYLTRFSRRLNNARVLELTYRRVSNNFDLIVKVQRKFTVLVGEARTESAFRDGLESFLESSEYQAVAPLTARIDLPKSPFEQDAESGPPLPPLPETPSEPVSSVPPTERERQKLYSAAEIEQFLGEFPGPENEAQDSAVDLESLRNQLSRVVNLFNASLVALSSWDVDPSRWEHWRDDFRATPAGLEALTNALQHYRDLETLAREQYVRAHGAMAKLERWAERTRNRVAVLTQRPPDGFSARDVSNLNALLRDLPRALIMAKQVIAMVDQRLDLFDTRSASTTDLALLVMHAQSQSIGKVGPEDFEPIREFLRRMTEALTPRRSTDPGAPR